MNANTKIEWADHTFNPWTGCTKVSPACDHCYAEGWAKRSGFVQWGAGAERRRTSESNWNQPLKWNAEAESLGIRYRVFCASLADVFDNEVPRQWRQDLFDLILATPHLDWLLLTKRIGNAARMLQDISEQRGALMDASDRYKPLPNVWIGATICNQEEADRDIPKLLEVPAAVCFLSMEPLLGPVDLTNLMADWVIVGGESGHGARPMHPDWVRSLRDQCAAAGVPFLFEQWGEWAPDRDIADDGSPFHDVFRRNAACEICEKGERVFRVGKQRAGRLLDGVQHDGFPVTHDRRAA